MEEWSIQDLDLNIDDFTMECAYDLLTAIAYKSGQYVYHLLPSLSCWIDRGLASRCTCSSSPMESRTRGRKSRS